MPTVYQSRQNALPEEASTAGELPSDSELLDLLDIDAALSNFLQCPAASATTPDASNTAANIAAADKACRVKPPPTSFLIGGSLFEPRHTSLLYTTGLRNRVGSLAVPSLLTAVFCPFTHQYVSLSSAHWHQLSSAGFGLTSGRSGAPRVRLRSVRDLRPYAYALQGSCGTEAKLPASECTLAHRDRERSARLDLSPSSSISKAQRERLFESWHWSESLRRTLGALLCAAPLTSLSALEAAVVHELQTRDNYDAARVIRRVPGGDARELPWRTRWKDLQWPASTTIGCPPALRGEEKAKAKIVVSWEGKGGQLEQPSRLASEAGAAEACAGERQPSPLSCALPSWTEHYTERQAFSMLGMPPHVRAAFLQVPLSSKPDSPALMRPVCAAVLTQLAHDLAKAAAQSSLDTPTPRLYYCPLAHGVDYSGVLDLLAFPVPLGGGNDCPTPPSTISLEELCGEGSAAAAAATQLLSLGMESAEIPFSDERAATRSTVSAPLQLVVFDNAHLLSKRAISRMLDQWTRNGSASERQRDRMARHTSTPPPSSGGTDNDTRATPTTTTPPHPPRWQTLMGAHVAVGDIMPHLRTLAAPFGDVQAIFLSYRPGQDTETATTSSGTSAETHAVSMQMLATGTPAATSVALIGVSPTPQASILHIEEPLAAALLRVSALYHLRLTPKHRRELLEHVVRCVVSTTCAGSDVPLVRNVTRTLPSGTCVSEKREYRLCTPKGQALLYEACEAVLCLISPLDAFLCGTRSHADQLDATVRALTTYPTLTALHVRHTLVSTYHLHVSLTTAAEGKPRAITHNEGRSRVFFLPSRQSAYTREAAERRRLMQQGRIRAASTTTLMRFSDSCFSQTYCVYAEPPLLVGKWWTATLLFCAPTLADVMSLRSYLLCRLRERVSVSFASTVHFARQWEAGVAHTDAWNGDSNRLHMEVEDVDIFHTEFADSMRPSGQTARVFGVRVLARFAEPAGKCSRDERFCALRRLEGHLQKCLKRCASRSLFFPLWTYRASKAVVMNIAHGQRTEDGPSSSTRAADGGHKETPHADSHDGGPGAGAAAAAASSTSPSPAAWPLQRRRNFPDFDVVFEKRALWIPSLVERRLLTLAVAQRPPLALAIGTRVVLQEAVRVPGRGGKGREEVVTYPRMCVCRVTGFVPMKDLFDTNRALPSARIPRAVRRQVSDWTCEERQHVRRYMEQQQKASSLPLLRCLRADAAEGSSAHPPGRDADDVFVLAPRPFLVGGYRSIHYYGLPVLHLPICVITGGADGAMSTYRARRYYHTAQRVTEAVPPPGDAAVPPPILTVTSPAVSLDFVLTDVFHPYHADSTSSKAALCLSPAERAQALRLLFARMETPFASPAVSGGSASSSAVANQQARGVSSSGSLATYSPLSFMEDVVFFEAAEDAPQRPCSPPAASAAVTAAPVSSALLTELGLYARLRSLRAK